MIGAYDNNGQLCGILDLNSDDGNHVMTLFGDDPSTVEKEGFTSGETINFRALSYKTNEVANLELSFEFEPENPLGNFRDMTTGKVTKISLLANGMNFINQNVFNIYPNPTTSNVYITGADGIMEYEVEIFAAKGEVMIMEKFTGKAKLDVSSLRQGVYFIRISGNDQLVTQKLIIQ